MRGIRRRSPHKFVGGPGTPGVLAVKTALLNNTVPAVVGGGTVAYVTPTQHRYLADPQRREEAGTPAIVESIRAGLVIGLQQAIGTDIIEALEREKVARVRARLHAVDTLQILGPADGEQLAIFSLRFFAQGRELHYGFVVALLNDLFGIQARGGCSCAGPYGHSLLGLDEQRSQDIDTQIAAGVSALRPGWVRLNFNYFISEGELDYLLGALELVAEYGWRLLPAYTLDWRSGLWRHRDTPMQLPVRLDPMTMGSDGISSAAVAAREPDFAQLLMQARRILLAGASARHIDAAARDKPLPANAEVLRWFSMPGDADAGFAGECSEHQDIAHAQAHQAQ